MPARTRNLIRHAILTVPAALAAGFFGCGLKGARPGRQAVSVFVSSGLVRERLAEFAGVVRSARQTEPTVWVVLGDILADRVWTELGDGAAQAVLLNAAGVDAVVLGPEWLELGSERLRSLVDLPGLYFLSANILDSLAGPVGHPFMLKRFPGLTLGLCGAWLDSTDARFGPDGVACGSPDFAVRKLLPLVRPRADVAGVAVRPGARAPGWDVDFVAGAESEDMIAVAPTGDELLRLRLLVGERRVLSYTVAAQNLAGFGPDSTAKAVLDSVGVALDSAARQVAGRLAGRWSPASGTRELVREIMRSDIDGFLLDRPLFRDTLNAGPVTNLMLVEALASPGRLIVAELAGHELDTILAERSVEVEWRKGLAGQRPVSHRRYKVAMTPDFRARHPLPAGCRCWLSGERLWRIAARLLARTALGS